MTTPPGNGNQPQKRNVDERIDAIAISLELLTHDVEALREQFARTDVKIDRLAEIVTSLVQLKT